MAEGIFVPGDGGVFHAVGETAPESEESLQALIADTPELLPGAEMSPDSPLQWLLIEREAGVPDGEGFPDRWALDHLFVDQNGVPTFVEVKRSTNTEIRRRIVGQMLDYAANAIVYWPADKIRSRLITRVGRDREAVELTERLGVEENPDEFWKIVDTNLRAGSVRMLFVADRIPDELRRIVAFLSAQLQRAEVFAIEVRAFGGQPAQAIVTSVVAGTPAPSVAGESGVTEASKSGMRMLDRLSSWATQTHLNMQPTGKGQKVVAATGATLLWVYASWEYAEIDLALFRGGVDGEIASQIRERIRRITGIQPPRRYPKLWANSILTRWEELQTDVLGPLLDAVMATRADPPAPLRR